ncbi:DNA-directed DNA polymerase [Tanacetum coccineum]
MNERCSAVLLNKLPLKEKDPGSFTIPCDIGQLYIDNALADLGASISLMPYTMYKKHGLGEPKATRMSLELADRPFLATARSMIDVFNKKITLRVGDDEVAFDVDQSIKRPTTEDDECYGIDDLDDMINEEAQELLENEEPDSFLSRGLEKSIDQSDLECCKSASNDGNNEPDPENSIRRIDSANTPYLVTQGTTKCNDVKSEHLYAASANEIDEKKPKLKNLPQHLEYTYLYGVKSFPIIISSELSEKEKISLLYVLEKRKGAIAWKMSDIKGISPSYCIHKILMEDDYKPVIQPQRRLNPKVQDVVKNKIVKLLDSGLIYPISNSLWVSPIHVDSSKYQSLWRIKKRLHSPVLMGLSLTDECRSNYVMLQQLFKDAWRQSSTTWWKTLWKFSWTTSRSKRTQNQDLLGEFYFSKDLTLRLRIKKGAQNLAADHLSRLENPDSGTFTEEEITDEFPNEHLMILKAELNNDEPCCARTIMRRCVAGNEILEILAHCHSGPTRGHHSMSITGRKVYESGFYWPNIFKDAKDYVMRCDACQRSGNI